MSRGKRHPRPDTRGSTSSRQGQGELRILGGDWRSRVLHFPGEGGVRPTPARTRETLFNWLAFHLAGSHCLDLFSGSGVLGLEALSRGASSTLFVDHTSVLCFALRDNLRLLRSDRGTVVCQDVLAFLDQSPSEPVDILFMDAPFRQGWLDKLIPLIDANHWIKPGGWVYLEYESEHTAPAVPAHWHLHRDKRAGQVSYGLYRIEDKA